VVQYGRKRKGPGFSNEEKNVAMESPNSNDKVSLTRFTKFNDALPIPNPKDPRSPRPGPNQPINPSIIE